MTIKWLHPEWFHALWLIWALVVFSAIIGARRLKRLRIVFGDAGLARHLQAVGVWRFTVRAILYGFGLSGVVLALARPQWGFHYEEAKQKGSELVLAIDVSESMMAEDLHPSRLGRARRALEDLSQSLQGDSVGIVAFAGVPFLLCPPTSDYDALRLFFDMLDPSLIPVQGTDFAAAIEMALTAFNEKTAADNRAIVLITDGEDHGERLASALDRAKDKGVRVFVVGLGSPQGAPIPLAEGGGFKKDKDGSLVLSRLDDKTLAEIAEKTGGSFIRNDGDRLDLQGLYEKKIRGKLGESETSSKQRRIYHERFLWPLGFGLFCLALAPLRFVPWTRAGQVLIGHALLFVIFLSASNGYGAEPDNPKRLYNLGNTYYDAKAYDKAEAAYNNALDHVDLKSELGKETLFNLGNTFYREGKLDKAVESYEKLLALDPTHHPAELNRDFVKKKLEEKKNDQNKSANQDQNKKDSKQSEQDNKQGDQSKSQGDQGQAKDQGKSSSDKTKQSDQTPAEKDKQGQTQLGQKPLSPGEAKKLEDKKRAERWLEAMPENGEQILERQVRERVPQRRAPEKDW